MQSTFTGFNMLLHSYTNGDTSVSIYSDGTKIRDISKGTRADFPESIDVKITNWCDAGCHWCHEKSTPKGWHGNLQETLEILTQLPAGVEIAIGGGHPLSHPGFIDFVRILSSKGIICNVTINEKHFEKELMLIQDLVSKGFIKGVGYSYNSKPCTWKYEHLVTHVIIGLTDPKSVGDIVKVNPKILLLGYKSVGRGILYRNKFPEVVEDNIAAWYRLLPFIAREAHLSFDNLAIEQLKPARIFRRKSDYEKFYMGRDGVYSMYMDAVTLTYSQSSTHSTKIAFGKNIKDMFLSIHPENINAANQS